MLQDRLPPRRAFVSTEVQPRGQFHPGALMLPNELSRTATLGGPGHGVQILQIKPRIPQLDRGQANR